MIQHSIMKRNLFLVGIAAFTLLALHFSYPTMAQKARDLTCQDLKSCVAHVLKEDACEPNCDGAPIERPYLQLPEHFRIFARPGVDALLPLLNHQHPSVRAKAAFILSSSPFLDSRDSQQVVSAYRRGNGWLTWAVGKVAGEKEIPSLVSEGIANPREEFGQLLEALGERAEPAIAEALNCSSPERCELVVRSLTKSLNFNTMISPELSRLSFDIADDRRISSSCRQKAVDLAIRFSVGYSYRRTGLIPASWALERLRVLGRDSDANVSGAAKSFLIDFKDASMAAEAVRMLDKARGFDRQIEVLRIGMMGPAALSAAPKLRELLSDGDWDVRVAAAEALGKIGAIEAASQLAGSISSTDWLLSLRAVEALGALKSPEAMKVLNETSANYWHPAVREAAKRAISGTSIRNEDSFSDFMNPIEFYCSWKETNPTPPANFEDFSEVAQMDFINDYNARLARESFRLFSENVALRGSQAPYMQVIHKGWTFKGTDLGEFGGNLTAVSSSASRVVIDDNVVGLFKIGDQLYGVTGLDHLGLSYGFLWQINFAENGAPSAKIVMRMSGAPHAIRVAPNGTVGIYGSLGSMLVLPDGMPQWLACQSRHYIPRNDLGP